ncbi:hypothetical protein CJF31_00003969 [Rutstroemia sp. NJR-2017a BVV2]|nr:hypothetical protein CJF31_00003969 [Rutstroemia sp. NJR-2017a BVV2]
MQSERYDSSPSSPDPLNDSLVFRAPPSTKRRKTPHSRLSLPTPGSSPRKQIFELDVGDAISPQKIRVTVQAGDSDEEDDHANLRPHNFSSPTPAQIPRRIERTTTTTVPLRGLSDTEDNVQYSATPKRGRGRPRKSVTPAKILPTPIRGRKRGRKSVGEQVDDQDANDYFTGDTEERSHKKQRSRSVKGVTPRKSTPSKKKTTLEGVTSSVVGKRGRGRPRSKLREEILLSEDRNDQAEEPKATNDESQLGSPKSQENYPLEEPQPANGSSWSGVQDIHEDLLQEEIDLLETIDANPSSPRSTYPTDQSTSPIPSIEGDIVIARFHPGEETPRTTGWSSSRFMDEQETVSSPTKAGAETRPYEEDTRSAEPLPQSDALSDEEHENYEHRMEGSDDINQPIEESDDEAFSDDDPDDASEAPPRDDFSEDEMEDDDDDDHRPEFDTIMESEGFSLISLNSVPSLRKPLSGPVQEQEQTPALPLQHKGLLSVQGVHNAGENDSFSSIASETLQAATPGMKAHNPQLLRVENTRDNDSFSSIPPEILEAATPARNLNHKQSSQSKDSSGIEEDEASKAIGTKSLSKSPVTASKSNSVYNDDSFSTIPPSILEAATPRPLRKAPLRPSSLAKSKLASSEAPSSSQKQSSSSPSTGLSKKMNSLSPPAEEAQPDPANPVIESPASRPVFQSGEDSLVNSQMQSSPPIMAPRGNTHTAPIHQQRQADSGMTQTPPILFSSPSLPPPIQLSRQPSRQPSERPDSSTTNAPSPAEKAGRVLQDIVIPSSLPRSRSQSLASPFKSPAIERKSSSSLYPETNVTRSNPTEHPKQSLPKLDHNDELMPKPSHRRNWSRTIHHDAFSNSGGSQRRFSTDKSFNLTLPSSRRLSNSVNATVSPRPMPVQQEEAVDQNVLMRRTEKASEETPAVPSPAQLRARAGKGKTVSWEEKWASERAAVSKQISAADDNKVIVVESEDDNQDPNNNSDAEVEEEDEEQGMEIDQINDKAAPRPDEHAVIEDDDDEDFGLLLETLNSSQQEAQLISDLSDKPKRSKLPSPWRKNGQRLVYSDEIAPGSPPGSAPRAIPEDNPSPRTIPRQADGKQQPQSNPPIDGDETLDLSGWHIPQKSNFEPKPRPTSRRNSDISALLGSPPMQGLTDITNGRDRTNSAESASVEPESAHKPSTKSSLTESINSIRERVAPYIPIPQKVGFQPRPRKAAEEIPPSPTPQPTSISKGIFGLLGARTKTKTDLPTPDSSSSMVGTLTNTSPSRSNMLKNQSKKAFAPAPSAPQNHKENHHPSSNNKSNNENPPPKWTQPIPPLQAPLAVPPSPTKSILRSPQRPSFLFQPLQPSPSKTVIFASSSPQSSSSGSPSLSPTVWTKDHWLLLDAIVKSWKPENQDEGEGGKYGRRNSTRVISRLLGKWVSLRNGNGKVKGEDGVVGSEKMRLEQWHLEAVDEFRGEVPGWDEKVVAKRVFALIVGEERRRKGLIK